MIELLEQSTANCLVARISGKITGEEYQQFNSAVTSRLQNGGHVDVVLDLSGFEVYGDREAARDDVKFAFGEYKHLHRVAFVGDQKWLAWFARLIDPFTRAEEKHFPAGQLEAALTWANQ